MAAGFAPAGSLSGAPATIMSLDVGETIYQGMLAMSNLIGGTGGHVQIADVSSEAHENDLPILGIVMNVQDDSRAYSSTYYGDGSTYTTTQSVVLATGKPAVEVAVLTAEVLVSGPIFNAAFGTALTECTATSASSGGTTATHASDTVTDIADDLATLYCRSGANAGQYRVVTTGGANANVVTVPFPKGIAIGDVFVIASCVLGLGGIDVPATANCIDGNNDLDTYWDTFGHKLDLSQSGKEKFVFRFLPIALGPITA